MGLKSVGLSLGVGVSSVVTASVIVSCSGGSGSVGTGTYIVSATEVQANGCLNLGLLFGRMKKFPSGTAARRVTTDIKVQGTDGTRETFLTFLTRSTFRLDEKDFSQLSEFGSAEQLNCRKVTLINNEGDRADYEVKDSSPTSLTISGGGKIYQFLFQEPTDLRLTSTYQAADPCNSAIGTSVTTTEVMHWGDPAIVYKEADEKVSVGMLRALARSTNSVPTALNAIISSEVTVEEVKVSTVDLKQLRDSEVRTDILACLPPFPTPIPPPAEPSPAPSENATRH